MKNRQLFPGRRKIWYAVGIGILAIVVVWYGNYTARERQASKLPLRGTARIALTEKGYEPEELTVEVGTVVTFSTKTGKHHWPASNLHPTHDLYAEFDPRKPISPDETWSFQFMREGTWGFHDHLSPYYTGRITVVPVATQLAKRTIAPLFVFPAWEGTGGQKTDVDTCEGADSSNKKECWNQAVRTIVQTNGVASGLATIARLSQSDSGFAAFCHELTHIVGQKAYAEFSANKKLALTTATSICAFGFYHGFMEAMVVSGGSIEEARRLCSYVDATLGSETPNAVYACYHGIGHGTTDIHNPIYRANEWAVIQRALSFCDRFATQEEQRTLCATGVFDSVSLAYYNSENGMVMRRDDPLWLCKEQPVRFKEACYRDLMPAVLWLGEHTLEKSAPIVLAHAEEQYRALALETIAENSVRFMIGKKPLTDAVDLCRSYQSYWDECIGGIAAGIIQFGPAEEEYREALSFCASPVLTDDERARCYQGVIATIKGRYSRIKVEMICALLPLSYRKGCADSL